MKLIAWASRLFVAICILRPCLTHVDMMYTSLLLNTNSHPFLAVEIIKRKSGSRDYKTRRNKKRVFNEAPTSSTPRCRFIELRSVERRRGKRNPIWLFVSTTSSPLFKHSFFLIFFSASIYPFSNSPLASTVANNLTQISDCLSSIIAPLPIRWYTRPSTLISIHPSEPSFIPNGSGAQGSGINNRITIQERLYR